MSEPNFDQVEQLIRDAGSVGEVAEIHGEFCGLACVMGADAIAAWAQGALADASRADDAATTSLHDLAATTYRALEAGDMSVAPLLPDDNCPLEQRAESLGLWCQGFMHGIGRESAKLSDLFKEGVVAEVVEDFSEITRASFAETETATEAENAYAELVEFLRVSAQLVFEELAPVRGSLADSAH